jgi:hypothetical protein
MAAAFQHSLIDRQKERLRHWHPLDHHPVSPVNWGGIIHHHTRQFSNTRISH